MGGSFEASAYRRVTDELAEWADKVCHRDRLQARCVQLEERLMQQRRALAEAAANLQSEERDVERLMGLSITRFMARVSAEGLQGHLARERREANLASVRVAGLAQHVAVTEREWTEAQRMLAQLGDVDAGYQGALDAKSRWLASVDDERGRYVRVTLDGLVRAQHWRRELLEALQAGEGTAEAILVAARHLRSASSALTVYNFGGGILAGELKESSLRDGVRSLAVASRWLERFELELRDIAEKLPEGARLHALDRRPKDWIESVFGDPNQRQKIEASLANLREVYGHVVELLQMLRARALQHDAHLQALWNSFRAAVETA